MSERDISDFKEHMPYRFLGKTGLKVSAFGFGSWVNFDKDQSFDTAYDLMKTAFDSGINYFDTAENYGEGEAEVLVGKILKKAEWDREDYVISTKLFFGGKTPNKQGLSRKHIIEGMKKSLKRLQLEYVDIVFCHRPDIDTPIEETVFAMNYLINKGMALYWGTSEWHAQDITLAIEIAKRHSLIPPVVEQPQYNLLSRKKVEFEFKKLYKRFGLGTTVYSPLAMGLLTGKYNKGIPSGTRFDEAGYPYKWLKALKSDQGDEIIAKLNKIDSVAKDVGCSMAQLSLLWCLKNENVSTVLLGASKVEQLRENLGALKFVDKITPEVLERVNDILGNEPKPLMHHRCC